jgi:hypothetical protein
MSTKVEDPEDPPVPEQPVDALDEKKEQGVYASYPARLEVDYPEGDISRMEVLLRIFKIIPAFLLYITVCSTLLLSTIIMIVSRQEYPRWWFDFQLESKRYSTRFSTFLTLMTNKYPSTTKEQIVHLDIDYPDAKSLHRWGPLYKIFLAIPHFLILFALKICFLVVLVAVWITVLITGKYPKSLFDFIVGYWRWGLRFSAYALLMVTDQYPPFSTKA